MRTHLVLILVLLGSLPAAAMPVLGAGDATPVGEAGAATVQEAPPDPESDVLGWENGVWHNESVALDQSDGLNETELDRIVNRTMARVELVRELEFGADVPVNLITRKELQNRVRNGSTSAELRKFDNVKFEALFMINESTDSIAVQDANSGASILGFYNPRSDQIVLVSEGESAETVEDLDEITLAHELLHALQDQQFDLTSFERRTREEVNTINNLIEGDPELLEVLYRERCGEFWDTCLIPEQQGGGGELANIGPFILKFQPRSDGPAFVQRVQQEGGWEAVNELYENPPASTEQFIHPNKFPDDGPTNVRVKDKTSNGWERIEVPGRPNAAVLGETGFFSMFLFPTFDSQGQTQIVPISSFRNTTEDGGLQTIDGLNYNHPLSAGWDGDKLVPYVNNQSESLLALGNETGYVWKSVWDSEADAEEFVEGYRRLLEYRNAEPVEGRENTYRIPESEEFSDAFYVTQNGDTVIIVNAPTVEDLPNVREGAAPESN